MENILDFPKIKFKEHVKDGTTIRQTKIILVPFIKEKQ
jgi:hypothetical protein